MNGASGQGYTTPLPRKGLETFAVPKSYLNPASTCAPPPKQRLETHQPDLHEKKISNTSPRQEAGSEIHIKKTAIPAADPLLFFCQTFIQIQTTSEPGTRNLPGITGDTWTPRGNPGGVHVS